MIKYRASPVSREKLRHFARRFRAILGIENKPYLDVLGLLEHVLPRMFPGFEYEIVQPHELGNMHGLTDVVNGKVYIRSDVYEGAVQGVGRDRFTIAHEIAHYLLLRVTAIGLARVVDDTEIPRYCDPEWQADTLAGELLMPFHLTKGMEADTIIKECCVSRNAALIQKRIT